jgi:hypothetical protein
MRPTRMGQALQSFRGVDPPDEPADNCHPQVRACAGPGQSSPHHNRGPERQELNRHGFYQDGHSNSQSLWSLTKRCQAMLGMPQKNQAHLAVGLNKNPGTQAMRVWRLVLNIVTENQILVSEVEFSIDDDGVGPNLATG